MKTWNRFSPSSSGVFTSVVVKAGFCLLFLSIIASGAFAQNRVANYTVQTSFSGAGEWNDLSGSDNASYIGDEIFGWSGDDENGNPVNTTLPFDFKYDDMTISAGSTLYLGAGSFSFLSTPPAGQQSGGLTSNSFPEAIYFWGGAYSNAGAGVDVGQDYYGVYTETDGTAPNQVFTIQWTDVHSDFYSGVANYGTQYLCSMQVKIYQSSGVIQMLYQNHGQDLGGYGDEYGSFYQSAIGLNGGTSPSFSSLTYESSVTSTPSTDLQFSPPAPPQELSLEPDTTNYVAHAINFGTTTAQLPIEKCATAASVGGVGSTLHITGFTLTGSSAFTMVSGPSVGTAIPVGSSVNYCFEFLPLSPGIQNATFTLMTDGVDSGKQIISMTGIGAVPLVSYSANTMFRGVTTELTDTSAVQYLYVNSIGQEPLVVNSASFIGLDARAYIITHLPVGPISAGGVDSIGVRFVPDLEGLPDAHMVINSTAANIPWDTVQMFGVGILPHLAIDSAKSWPLPTTVNFDSVKLGADSTIVVQLWNPGSDTVAIEQNFFESDDPDFTFVPLAGRDTLLAPGGTQTIHITFRPVQQGTRMAIIRIRTDIPHTETNPAHDTSQFTINIIGVGVPTGKLLITGLTNGSTLLDKSVCATDTFWNTGDAPLTVDSVAITGTNAADFTATYPTLPFTIGANSTQTFSVCADPADTGTETAILTGYGSSNDAPAIASLGLAVYGEELADTAIVTQAFLPGNCGLDTMLIAVTNTGNVADSFTASIPLNSNFKLLGTGTSPLEPAGSTATFMVLFTPTTTGTVTGTLNIVGGSGVTAIPLSANAGAAAISGDTSAPMTAVGVTSTPFTVIVNNTGTCPWTSGTTVTVDPQFSCSTGSTTIAAGSSAPFTFTYTPTSETPNTYAVTFPGASISSSVNVNITTTTDAVQPEESSNGFSLNQNYPNPFNETSNVEITLPVASLVHLNIIDVQGQVVETLLNQHYDAGSFEVSLDATGLASGTYYYQMTAGDVTLTRQMVILK